MAEQANEKDFRFLEPVEHLPPTKRRKPSFYDEIIDEFRESGLKFAEVKGTGRSPETVQIMLSQRLKERKEECIKVRLRNKKVYLERMDVTEKTLYDWVINEHSVEHIDETRKNVPTEIKPSIDVMHLLNSVIIKIRCPKCKALNTKDARYCRECDHSFYRSNEEYHESLRSMQKLEKELSSKE
ncbi:MAG: zinc ribbon domain-containing protein [Candidatus Bathyarchaeia archaeon]